MSAEQNKPKPENPFAGLLRLGEMPLAIAGMAGITFKIFHLPAATMLLILSMSTLSIFYLFEAIGGSTDEKISATGKMVLKFNGIGCSIAAIGILFLLLRWPGSAVLVLMSSVTLLASGFYMINANSKASEFKPFASKTIYRSLGIAALEILLFLIPQQQ